MNDKKNILQHIDSIGLWVTKKVMDYHWLFIVAVIATVIAAVTGIGKIEMLTDYRDNFGADNPQLLAFENIEEQYTKLDNFLIVVKSVDGDVFSKQFYPVIQKITEQAWQLPGVNRVNSLSNYQHTKAENDDLIVTDLLEAGIDFTETELAEKRAAALAEPTLRGYLISDDATTTGIDIKATLGEGTGTDLVVTMAAVRTMLDQLRQEYPGLRFAVVGNSAMSNAFNEAAFLDISTLLPLMYLALLIVMLLIYRSISATVITFVIVICSSLFAVGMAGHLGWQMSNMSTGSPIIIMTLAVADSVHILMSMLLLMRRGKDKQSAIIEAMRINYVAVGITSVTTMIGFASLNFSDTPPLHVLGNISVLGIFAAWALSIILIPALVKVLPFNIKQQQDSNVNQQGQRNFVNAMLAVSRFTRNNSTRILVTLLPLCVVIISFIPQLELDEQFLKMFNHRVEFKRDSDFVLENLTGAYYLDFDIGSGSEGGITDIDYLNKLEEYTLWLRAQPNVRSVHSFTDVMKRLNKSMHGDDEDYYRLPDMKDLAAQYLLLYELSLPYGQDLNDRIKFDKSASRLTVVLDDITATETRGFATRADQWLIDNADQTMHATGVGASLMFAHLTKRNLDSMIQGNMLAVLMITIVMVIALGSIRMGFLSLIPNLLPILVSMGIWTIMVGMAGMSVSVIGVMSLGIVVDNTTHFLIKYIRARKEAAKSIADALDYAFEMVGAALVANAGILIAGFSLLAFSTFRPNFEMGVLMALVIAIALIIDLLLLPALLLVGDKKNQQ